MFQVVKWHFVNILTNIQYVRSLSRCNVGTLVISANKNWLAIVYRNLLSNAIRYTQKGGVIAYGFEDKGEMYHLNVYNSGKPISAEKRRAIFEMFESEGSTGIGLPVSRELVRRHGGDLWYGESPDGHPNFVFSIPKG